MFPKHLVFSSLLLPLTNIVNAAAVSADTAQEKTCTVEGTRARVNCRLGPGRDFASVRTLAPGESFSVACMNPYGEGIDGESAWGYVPAWQCWLAIRWTDLGCKKSLPTC